MTQPTVDNLLAHIEPVTDAATKAAEAAAEHAQAAVDALAPAERESADSGQQGASNGR